MTWKSEKREYTEHRWVLRQPAHRSDVLNAIDAANRQWVSADPSGRSEITVHGEDDHIVIAFTAPRVTGKRESLSELFAPDEDNA